MSMAANHDSGTEQYGNLREQSRVVAWQVMAGLGCVSCRRRGIAPSPEYLQG